MPVCLHSLKLFLCASGICQYAVFKRNSNYIVPVIIIVPFLLFTLMVRRSPRVGAWLNDCGVGMNGYFVRCFGEWQHRGSVGPGYVRHFRLLYFVHIYHMSPCIIPYSLFPGVGGRKPAFIRSCCLNWCWDSTGPRVPHFL